MSATAVFEYYSAEFSSETGSIANVTLYTYVHQSNKPFMNFSLLFKNEVLTSDRPQGSVGFTGTANGSFMGTVNCFRDVLNQTVKPETLTLTVRRIGWIILNDDSTTVHLTDSDIVAQIQMQPYREGFIYNNVFAEEQLSQINPTMPQFTLIPHTQSVKPPTVPHPNINDTIP
jgi:hypothetical protein